MASQVGDYHPKFEGGKVVSAVVMPPQAHRELQGKQNKTKQNSTPPRDTEITCNAHLQTYGSVFFVLCSLYFIVLCIVIVRFDSFHFFMAQA